MGVDLAEAVSRQPLTDLAEAFSGARLELVQLAGGSRLVVKHLPAEGDWLTRATDGVGRLRVLWERGVLDRVGHVADHTILDMQTIDDRDVVVMRDASGDLLPPRSAVTRETARLLLARLGAIHASGTAETVDGLCSIGARYGMFTPTVHARDRGPGPHPIADRIVRGWELFAEHVDPDVVDAVFAVHREPERLERQLGAFPTTVLHGDAKLENLGLGADGRLVAIDWGDLTGVGPREIDVAWFALKGAARIGCSPGDVFADYETAVGSTLEPDALDLVCVGSLAQMGFRFAVGSFAAGPEPPDVARALLDWWVARARTALDRLGTI